MDQVKRHIGWLLLWIFLVPQFNNALHFWVIKHDFLKEFSAKPVVSSKSLVHYCDQTLFKMPSLILAVQNFEIKNFEEFYLRHYSTVIHEFLQVYFIGYYLRGPPTSF